MATSSQALARAGLIDPTKPGSYPVVLGDDIRRSSNGSTDRVFTGIRYNFKPKHLTDKTTQKTSTLTSNGDGDFDVTFRDNSGGRYIFAGQRVTKGGKYVLVFDSKGRKFILHRLDSLFVMNMADTPTDHDTDGLKKKHPYIDALTKRPRPRGATPLARRPMMKKAPGGPLRPMQKSSSRPPPKPTVLRSSHEIKKKDKRVMLSVPTQEPERETKAAKEVREQREAIIVKDARSSKEARGTPNGKEKNESDSSGSSNSPSGSTLRDARENAAVTKSRLNALAARPKESSKLWRETKASPDRKSAGYGSGDDYKSRSIDVKSFKEPKDTKDTKDSKASESAKSQLAERPNKATPSKGASKESIKDTVRVATKKDTGKDASTPRGKDGGKTGTSASTNAKTGKSAGKAKASAPVSLPMPEAPAPAPAAAAAAAAAPSAPKKKQRDWEEEDEEDEDDDDFGFVIEYPEGPSHRVRGAASANARNGASSTPQLHMTTFAEFANGGDGEEEDDGFWDVTKDDKTVDAEPASTPGKSFKSSGHTADDADADADADADVDADLEAELEKELNKEMNAGVDVDAALEAELEAEFFAAESESEISEEE